MSHEVTLPTDGDAGERGRAVVVPQLIVAMDCDEPRAGSSRHLLADVDHVVIGRGRARGATRSARRLTLSIPDRRMSARHAELVFVRGRWVVVDAGSRNGTFVDGASVSRRALGDGDLLQLGHTLLLFRDAVPPARAAEPDVDLAPGATLSARVEGLLDTIARVAPTTVPLLLLGETGAGKEVAARFAHERSGRNGPYVPVNCGAIPANLVEAELFGHKKGAFSGADTDRPGLIRAADRGTLFLDEIGELPLPAQAALLRVLQEREVLPIGHTKAISVDVRVVAATNRDLAAMIEAGQFRRDLHARLAGVVVELVPLRERVEDLGSVAAAMLRAHPRVTFRPEAARRLFGHDWPYNFRELERCLESAAALAAGAPIEPTHLPATFTPPPTTAPLTPDDDARRAQLIALFTQHDGNIAAVARALGKGRMQIHRWIERYGLDVESYRR